MTACKIARFAVDRHRVVRENGRGVEQRSVMFATVEAVAQTNAIWATGCHKSDVAAQTAAGVSFHIHALKDRCLGFG